MTLIGFEKTRRGLMPAGFLDTTDMVDIKQEMRRKKRIVIRWHLFAMLSLNPTLLKYRYKNPKKRRYHLDLINQLNPALYWPEFNKEEESDTEEEVVRHILDNDGTPGGPKFNIRCKKTGKLFEVVYSLKRMSDSSKDPSAKKSKWDKIAENLNRVTAGGISSGDNQIVEEEEEDMNENIVKDVSTESSKYRKLSSSVFIDIEAGDKGDNDPSKIQESDDFISKTTDIKQTEEDKFSTTVFIDTEALNDGENDGENDKSLDKKESDEPAEELGGSHSINTVPRNHGDNANNDQLINEGVEISESEDDINLIKVIIDPKESSDKNGIPNRALIQEREDSISSDLELLIKDDNITSNKTSRQNGSEIELGVMNFAYGGDDADNQYS